MSRRVCRKRNQASGFTLAELLVGLALLVMIMSTVAVAMHGAANLSVYGADKGRSLTKATLALSRMGRDIRRADAISLTTPSELQLTMPDGETIQYVWNGTSGDSLTYRSSQTPDGTLLVADVVDFSLEAVEQHSEIKGDLAVVSLKLELEVRHGNATTRLETTVRPRRSIL